MLVHVKIYLPYTDEAELVTFSYLHSLGLPISPKASGDYSLVEGSLQGKESTYANKSNMLALFCPSFCFPYDTLHKTKIQSRPCLLRSDTAKTPTNHLSLGWEENLRIQFLIYHHVQITNLCNLVLGIHRMPNFHPKEMAASSRR